MWLSEEHTAMYGLHPASLVFAMESTSWPLMPKSHNLMFPWRSRRMLEGFTSEKETTHMYPLTTKNTFFIFVNTYV